MKKIIINAKLENLSVVLDSVSSACLELGMDKSAVSELLVACEEIVVNIISYAYHPGQKGNIEIHVDKDDDGNLQIKIIDSGKPFDPLSMPDPVLDTPIEERPIGGLGIFLVKQFMDKVSYRREAGLNILTMVKKI